MSKIKLKNIIFEEVLGESWKRHGKDFEEIWVRTRKELSETWKRPGKNLGETWERLEKDLGKAYDKDRNILYIQIYNFSDKAGTR